MAILKLKPSCKDYLWGGTRLRTEFGIEYDKDPLAESWELSCHPDGPSYIVNGENAGKTLQQYIDENGKEILGTDCQSFEQFPVLIKFIDAKKDLSIQVHPDNAYALKNEGQYGKTEMWYVMDASEGASLLYGFSREVSEEEFEERIRNNTLPEVLNRVMIHKGDVLFIDPGTIHAIGAGDSAEFQCYLSCIRLWTQRTGRKRKRTSCRQSSSGNQTRACSCRQRLRTTCCIL